VNLAEAFDLERSVCLQLAVELLGPQRVDSAGGERAADLGRVGFDEQSTPWTGTSSPITLRTTSTCLSTPATTFVRSGCRQAVLDAWTEQSAFDLEMWAGLCTSSRR